MTLDTFEQSLLTTLREHVAARTPAPRRTRRRLAWAAAPVAGLAAIGTAFVLLQPSAAYAVSDTSNGDVVVTIHRLDDAAGLEKALADQGVKADVDYSAEAPAPHDGEGSLSTDNGSGTGNTEHRDAPGTTNLPRIETSATKDAFTMRFDPDEIPAGQVMHITTSGDLTAGVNGLRVSFEPAG